MSTFATFAIADICDALARKIRGEIRHISRLRVEVDCANIALYGTTDLFYWKQQAQETARRLASGPEVVITNNIEVI